MDEVEFQLQNQRKRLSREQVDRALREMPEGNGDIRVWAVETDHGRRFPLKAVFRRATGIDDFTPQRAVSVLRRLGYRVIDVTKQPARVQSAAPSGGGTAALAHALTSNGHSDNSRLAILRASIDYASTRPQMTAEDVVNAAKAFESFLSA